MKAIDVICELKGSAGSARVTGTGTVVTIPWEIFRRPMMASPTHSVPARSNASARGAQKPAPPIGPSTLARRLGEPANVRTEPDSMTRIHAFAESATKIRPEASTAIPVGPLKRACSAGPSA